MNDMHIFFFKAPDTTDIHTLSLHDALPISRRASSCWCWAAARTWWPPISPSRGPWCGCGGHQVRSEEHTSELQSRGHLVCRLLLEKKNINWFYNAEVLYFF